GAGERALEDLHDPPDTGIAAVVRMRHCHHVDAVDFGRLVVAAAQIGLESDREGRADFLAVRPVDGSTHGLLPGSSQGILAYRSGRPPLWQRVPAPPFRHVILPS